MKKILYIITFGLFLLAGLTACEQKEDPQPLETVDLRYLAKDNYDLDAVSPKAFTIVVKSTKPWTIKSDHPDWCIIDMEEGEAVPDSLVHVGKGENTNVTVQYYDNTQLDDRTDYIEIASFGFIGKRVVVKQRGIAYLNVPEADIEEGLILSKSGEDVSIHVNSNQDWSAKVLSGEWLKIVSGETGSLNGEVVLRAGENAGEKRYSSVGIYDRHGEERALISITQDGVQLDPESFEIRAGYDQLTASLSVVSNTKWSAKKSSESDTWFDIVNPDGHDGDDVLNLTFQDNSAGKAVRSSVIVLTTEAKEGSTPAEKIIAVKQAFPVVPERIYFNDDTMTNWSVDWDHAPVWTEGVGTLFLATSRLHNSHMPFGNYTFRWSGIQNGARVRHWFCFSDGVELKVDVRIASSKISFDFNKASTGDKPSLDAYTSVDFSQPIEVTYKFDPGSGDYCHVTYLYNGTPMGSFDTSADILPTVKWDSEVNMYVGVAQESGTGGSAVLEWVDYTAPIKWE